MNSSECLTEKILADAKAAADKIVGEAREKADLITKNAVSAAQSERAEKLAEIERAKSDIIDRAQSVAELDGRKIVLSAKKRAIQAAFSAGADAVKKDGKYLPAVCAAIEKWAENGDKVVVAESDKDIITAGIIAKIAAKCGKKLALSPKMGEFSGGVILESPLYDKNLTLDSVISRIESGLESGVAELLFKEA